MMTDTADVTLDPIVVARHKFWNTLAVAQGRTASDIQSDVLPSTALGNRPKITGVMGWYWFTVINHMQAFIQAKAIGITTVRLMRVLSAKDDWTQLLSVIDALKTNGFEVILCFGDLTGPKDADIQGKHDACLSLFQYLHQNVTPEYMQSLQFELFNEYGWMNLKDHCSAIFQAIAETDSDFKPRIIAGASIRDGFHTLWMVLNAAKATDTLGCIQAVSMHYYERGASGVIMDYGEWLDEVQSILVELGFQNLPLYVTEFNLDGVSSDTDLKTEYAAAWMINRLVNTRFYTPNIIHCVSGAYGQDYSANLGWLGLCIGYGGTYAPYPIYNALLLEQELGDGPIYPVDTSNVNIQAVTNGKGAYLLWGLSSANSSEIATIALSHTGKIEYGMVNAKTGNSLYVMNRLRTNSPHTGNYWNTSEKKQITACSSPWVDADTGIAFEVYATAETIIKIPCVVPGVMLLKVTPQEVA